MLFLFMLIPVTVVIVANVTTVSALVWLQFEMHAHHVSVQLLLVQEPLATVLTLAGLLAVVRVDDGHVLVQVLHHGPAQLTRRLLLVLVPEVVRQVDVRVKHFATLFT